MTSDGRRPANTPRGTPARRWPSSSAFKVVAGTIVSGLLLASCGGGDDSEEAGPDSGLSTGEDFQITQCGNSAIGRVLNETGDESAFEVTVRFSYASGGSGVPLQEAVTGAVADDEWADFAVQSDVAATGPPTDCTFISAQPVAPEEAPTVDTTPELSLDEVEPDWVVDAGDVEDLAVVGDTVHGVVRGELLDVEADAIVSFDAETGEQTSELVFDDTTQGEIVAMTSTDDTLYVVFDSGHVFSIPADDSEGGWDLDGSNSGADAVPTDAMIDADESGLIIAGRSVAGGDEPDAIEYDTRGDVRWAISDGQELDNPDYPIASVEYVQIVDDDVVIVGGGTASGMDIVGLSRSDGSVLWHNETDGTPLDALLVEETLTYNLDPATIVGVDAAVAPAEFERPGDGRLHRAGVVAEESGGVVAEKVDVLVAVDVGQAGAACRRHPERERLHVEHRPCRSARHHHSGSLVQLRRSRPLRRVPLMSRRQLLHVPRHVPHPRARRIPRVVRARHTRTGQAVNGV